MALNENRHRLPVTDPEYRYNSSRNPYWSKLRELEGRVYSDNETEVHRGKWRETFKGLNASSKLHVEVGTNAGHVILEWAARDPANAYIGIDWKYKAIFKAADKAGRRAIKNAIFFRAHAERLKYMFGEGEIDFLYVYFPDPWPKKAHWKNRYVRAENLRDFAKLLSPTGVFHIKTDHPGYFEWMEAAIEKTSDVWEVVEHSRDLHSSHPNPLELDFPEVTLFEKIFIKEKTPIQSVTLRRK